MTTTVYHCLFFFEVGSFARPFTAKSLRFCFDRHRYVSFLFYSHQIVPPRRPHHIWCWPFLCGWKCAASTDLFAQSVIGRHTTSFVLFVRALRSCSSFVLFVRALRSCSSFVLFVRALRSCSSFFPVPVLRFEWVSIKEYHVLAFSPLQLPSMGFCHHLPIPLSLLYLNALMHNSSSLTNCTTLLLNMCKSVIFVSYYMRINSFCPTYTTTDIGCDWSDGIGDRCWVLWSNRT
jgi:hypothetical protein